MRFFDLLSQFNQHKAKLIDVEAMVTFQERSVNKLGNMATHSNRIQAKNA